MKRFRFLTATALFAGFAMLAMPSCSKDDDSPQSSDNNQQQPDNNQQQNNNQQNTDPIDPSLVDAEGFVSADKLSEMITKLEAGNYEVRSRAQSPRTLSTPPVTPSASATTNSRLKLHRRNRCRKPERKTIWYSPYSSTSPKPPASQKSRAAFRKTDFRSQDLLDARLLYASLSPNRSPRLAKLH